MISNCLWLLRRDLVKATTANATLHINNSQTVTSTFTDTLESGQPTRFDSGFQLLRFLTKFLLILLCLGNDLLQLALFLNQVSLTAFQLLSQFSDIFFLSVYRLSELTDFSSLRTQFQTAWNSISLDRLSNSVITHII